ncbi:5-methylcytosine restriction system specificity protein McrC [Crocinitomix catalasitica]|uniref:5-methylcytosine restriction system specificity protein McrC n=1 Tax=Crocinitomix catalasitica TaxID=184607 RepID=UPI0006872CF5|nr:hypothetical protein [Crocinitomix catalasitica]
MIVLGEHFGFEKKTNRYFLASSNWGFCNSLGSQKRVVKHFNNNEDTFCFTFNKNEDEYQFETSYFIGVDWIGDSGVPINVQPKLNSESLEVDYLGMLFEALQESENFNHLNALYTIDFNAPLIEIEQKQDKLTPLIFIEFLQLLKTIVRRGLKKSYYKVTENLNSRVKGKILINATVKQNHAKQKMLYNVCEYQEFGFNSIENRLLKKALLFVKSALSSFKSSKQMDLSHVLDYILPAFQHVDENIDIRTVKHIKPNPLFKEYGQALKLAKLILKKYSYNISKTTETKIKTPPFWIDMTKLFELYVFKKMREVFPLNNEVIHHFTTNRQELDYIIKSKDGLTKMVVDAKYKIRYQNGNIGIDDARQVSGYSRLKSVYKELGLTGSDGLIDCLIIYPDQSLSEDVKMVNAFENDKVEDRNYVQVFKLGVRLPEIVGD